MTQPDLSYIHEPLRSLALPIEQLTLDPRNARQHTETDLKETRESLIAHGMRGIVVVQRNSDGKLIVRAGNGRVQIARQLGWTHLPCVVYEEGDEEAVKFAIRHNRTGELAGWNGIELKSLAVDFGFDVAEVGFTSRELDELLKGTVADPSIADLDGQVDEDVEAAEAIDPDEIEDYEAEKDVYLIKVENVPPSLKDQVVEEINAVLEGLGNGLVARAY